MLLSRVFVMHYLFVCLLLLVTCVFAPNTCLFALPLSHLVWPVLSLQPAVTCKMVMCPPLRMGSSAEIRTWAVVASVIIHAAQFYWKAVADLVLLAQR